MLEEVPDIDYADIGGLDDQIEQIRDAVELPFLHPDLFAEHQLPAAEGHPALRPARLRQDADRQGGRQLAGQEGRRAARATRSDQSYFLNIKGPELLNKYVGETERHIRLIFQRAREKAERGHAGHRVLRRDGLAVPHPRLGRLLRRRDHDRAAAAQPRSTASRALENVIVIGASNREDMIDPAILRPGRLDVKIKIERPDAEAAARHLRQVPHRRPAARTTTTSPSTAATATPAVAGDDRARRSSGCTPRPRRTASSRSPTPNGDKEILYFKDFNSGAMIQNIVRPGQEDGDQAAPRRRARRASASQHLLDVDRPEFKENEDLPNTTNPDDWAKISGKKGERIVYIRTLVQQDDDDSEGGRSIERVATGQYL